MSEKELKKLSKQGLFENDVISSQKFYEKCVLRKAIRHKFPTGKHETKQTVDYVHYDLWGPSKVPFHGELDISFPL